MGNSQNLTVRELKTYRTRPASYLCRWASTPRAKAGCHDTNCGQLQQQVGRPVPHYFVFHQKRQSEGETKHSAQLVASVSARERAGLAFVLWSAHAMRFHQCCLKACWCQKGVGASVYLSYINISGWNKGFGA
jgi:hypothetical protein